MSFPRYASYKYSGVEWLGQVPTHWTAKKIGAISSLKGRLGWQGLKADEYRDEGPYVVSSAHFDNHRIQWDKCPRVSQERYDTDNNIQLAVDDLLLMKDGAAMGKLAFVDNLPGPACLNSHLLLFRPIRTDGIKAYSPRFAFYFMQTGYFQEYIKVNGTGATFLGVSQETIGRYPLVLPPLAEQAAIVAFLDRETGKIDKLVAEQRRLMELMKEKRQAVISHVVTRGLNPATPLKPSGIEWLGEVPKHWKVMNIRHFAHVLRGKFTHRPRNDPAFYDGDFPFVQTGDITGSSRYIIGFKQTLNERGITVSKEFPKGTLVMAIAANIGDVAILDFPAYFPDSIVGLVPKNDVDLLYLYFLMIAMKQPMLQTATVSTQMNLNVDQICSLSAAAPPVDEQKEIVSHLDNELAKFDTLTAEAQRAVDLLQERRTALISAVVTGQIDVRPLAGKELVA